MRSLSVDVKYRAELPKSYSGYRALERVWSNSAFFSKAVLTGKRRRLAVLGSTKESRLAEAGLRPLVPGRRLAEAGV